MTLAIFSSLAGLSSNSELEEFAAAASVSEYISSGVYRQANDFLDVLPQLMISDELDLCLSIFSVQSPAADSVSSIHITPKAAPTHAPAGSFVSIAPHTTSSNVLRLLHTCYGEAPSLLTHYDILDTVGTFIGVDDEVSFSFSSSFSLGLSFLSQVYVQTDLGVSVATATVSEVACTPPPAHAEQSQPKNSSYLCRVHRIDLCGTGDFPLLLSNCCRQLSDAAKHGCSVLLPSSALVVVPERSHFADEDLECTLHDVFSSVELAEEDESDEDPFVDGGEVTMKDASSIVSKSVSASGASVVVDLEPGDYSLESDSKVDDALKVVSFTILKITKVFDSYYDGRS